MSDFPDNLEFNYAGEMRKKLLALFSNEAPSIYVDLENVERASLACVQLLIAAKNKAIKEKRAIMKS